MTQQTMNDGNTGDPSPFETWTATLPDEDRQHIEKNGYKDFGHLLASDKGAMAKLGRRPDELIVKPTGEFAENKDGYLAAMRALGAPAEPKGYGEAPKFEGLEFKDGAWDKLTTIFTESGVPPFMVSSVLPAIAEVVKGELGQQKAPEVIAKERFDAGMTQLKEKFGAKADEVVSNSIALMKAKDKSGEFAAFLEESGFGSDPRFIAIMADIQADYAESGLISRDGGRDDPAAMTPEQAKEELRKLEADEGFNKQLMTRNDPHHEQAVARRNQLFAMAYPNGA